MIMANVRVRVKVPVRVTSEQLNVFNKSPCGRVQCTAGRVHRDGRVIITNGQPCV